MSEISHNSGALYPWLMDEWKRIEQQIHDNQLPHALLINGIPGLGKRRLAEHLAARLLCQSSGQDKPCGECKSCALLKADSHPDLLFVEPEEKSRAIKIEQIRRLNRLVQQTAQLEGYKVIILTPAESLNVNAANALLKTLEEPPGQTLFILLSSVPGRIMATIRSRCNNLPVAVPEKQESVAWLAAQMEGDTERASLLLSLANQAPLAALSLFQEEKLVQRKAVIKGMLGVLEGRVHPVQVAKDWQAIEIEDVLFWMQCWVTDLLKFGLTNTIDTLKNRDLVKIIEKTSTRLAVDSLYLYLDKMQTFRQILLSGHNPNKILSFEDLLMNWRDCSFQVKQSIN